MPRTTRVRRKGSPSLGGLLDLSTFITGVTGPALSDGHGLHRDWGTMHKVPSSGLPRGWERPLYLCSDGGIVFSTQSCCAAAATTVGVESLDRPRHRQTSRTAVYVFQPEIQQRERDHHGAEGKVGLQAQM